MIEFNDLLYRLSIYLNDYSTNITLSQINKVKNETVDELLAYKFLLASYLNVDVSDIDKHVKKLDIKDYNNNPYYKNINLKNTKYKNWDIKYSLYKPYELFVFDDYKKEINGYRLNLGFFNEPFKYLAIYQNKRLWMSITPNEINTMQQVIENANGNILTLGLGLGYFAYMCSLKSNINKITVVEKDKDVIDLFTNVILPHFENKDKIVIIQDDAYNYVSNLKESQFDLVYVDIYHDAGDGLEVYKKMEKLNHKNIEFKYWIYDTISYYIEKETNY